MKNGSFLSTSVDPMPVFAAFHSWIGTGSMKFGLKMVFWCAPDSPRIAYMGLVLQAIFLLPFRSELPNRGFTIE